ncbi:hypothetical protein ACQEVB_25350 [Pseudonocardia sp. CA-107938]|uniref:hypothetical protein n=1 Tax=Pseudonocardia sp. CA-107938 TaxID=3240021 RepID=UPI003D93FDD8
MTNQHLTSAIAAERRRDLHAAAAHSRLVREATATEPTPAQQPSAPSLRSLFRRNAPA